LKNIQSKVAYFGTILDQNYPRQKFQAVKMEVKKMECKIDTDFIEVINCSVKTPKRDLNILHLRVFFIKEVKSLSVIFKREP
jgi:hypothetical protein